MGLRRCGRTSTELSAEVCRVPMPTTPDQLNDLIGRVAAADRAAFNGLYSATSAKLYGIVLRILKRRDLADEVLQETYIRIWKNARSFDPSRNSLN